MPDSNVASPVRLKFRTNYRKLVELLLYLTHKKPGTDHYAASKYVYLADKKHFNVYGRPIVNDELGAMPWGPVALRTYELLKGERSALRDAKITSLPFDTQHIVKNIFISNPRRAVNYDVFSETDIEVFDGVLKEYGHLTMPELHNATKAHFAYKRAWNNRKAESKLAEIYFEDLLDESPDKRALIDDLLPISEKI